MQCQKHETLRDLTAAFCKIKKMVGMYYCGPNLSSLILCHVSTYNRSGDVSALLVHTQLEAQRINHGQFIMSSYVQSSLWYYTPNKGAPIAFALLFLFSGLLHTYQTLHYKTWRTTLLLPWSALIMVAGFSLREAGAYHTDSLSILVASNVLIMSGPPAYAAVNYLVLSRALYYIPYLSPLHPGRVLTTFLALDGVIEALIVSGAVRLFNSDMSASQRALGASLVKAALIAQAATFALFVGLAAHFHYRAARARVLKRCIRTTLLVLYASSALIFARCVYRVAEFFDGVEEGSIYTTEAYFWVFDAALMWLDSVLLNVWHPGRLLPRSNKVFLTRDGVTEVRGPGWQDRRHWLVTLVDPFDVVGLLTGKDGKEEFWNLEPAVLEAMVERQREERERKKARRRKWWCVLLDPWHIYGAGGLVARGWRKVRGTGEAGARGVEQVVMVRSSPPAPFSSREKRPGDRVEEQMV